MMTSASRQRHDTTPLRHLLADSSISAVRASSSDRRSPRRAGNGAIPHDINYYMRRQGRGRKYSGLLAC